MAMPIPTAQPISRRRLLAVSNRMQGVLAIGPRSHNADKVRKLRPLLEAVAAQTALIIEQDPVFGNRVAGALRESNPGRFAISPLVRMIRSGSGMSRVSRC